MSGLVGYGSSSDEDESVHSKPESADRVPGISDSEALGEPYTTEVQNNGHIAKIDDDGPLLGPSIPSDAIEQYASYDEAGIGDLASLSERDLLRQLTQASHPMTEMPPSPDASPNLQANIKFKRFLELKAKGMHFNEDLVQKNAFQNPSLLATMMQRFGIDENVQYKSSLPDSILNTSAFPLSAYKEELLKSQQTIQARNDAKRKTQSAAGTRTIEFMSGQTLSRDSTPGFSQKRKRT